MVGFYVLIYCLVSRRSIQKLERRAVLSSKPPFDCASWCRQTSLFDTPPIAAADTLAPGGDPRKQQNHQAVLPYGAARPGGLVWEEIEVYVNGSSDFPQTSNDGWV
jgi:hypothetical protein